MVSFSSVLSAALLATASVKGLAVPYKAPPSGWASTYLEPYMTYHIRYMALDCQDKHNTSFFDTCCHPLLVDESLSSRPSQCTPSASASSSASAADATSTASASSGDDGDDDCDDGDDGDSDDGDDGDDDDDDCTDDSDTSTAASSTATSAPINVGSQPTLTTSSTIVESTSTHIPTSTHVSKSSSSVQTSSTHEVTSTKTSSSASSSSTSGSFITGGVATFFYQNGVAGACGTVHSDSALIAAIDQDRYGDSGNESSLCGKQVEITNTNNGKTVTVTIADDCPTCTNGNSIDLSVGAFTQIATEAEGEVPIKWKFVS